MGFFIPFGYTYSCLLILDCSLNIAEKYFVFTVNIFNTRQPIYKPYKVTLLRPPSDSQDSRLHPRKFRESRIESRVSGIEMPDCQLTFEQYCRMPEQKSGVQFLFVNGTYMYVIFLGTWKFSCFYSWCRPTGAVFINKNLILAT